MSYAQFGAVGTSADVPFVVVAQDGSGDFNGTTSTPINAAISRLSSTGGIVYIKSGTYTIDAQILISSANIGITGEGWSTVLSVINSLNQTVIKITASHVKIENLKLLCNGTNQNNNIAVNKAINYVGATYGSVYRVWVQDPCNCGIQFENGSDHGTAVECRVINRTEASYSADCMVAQNSAYCTFVNCFADTTPNSSDNGIGIFSNTTQTAGQGCRVINCICTNNLAFGINFEDVKNGIAVGNFCTNNRGGISVHDSGLTCDRISIVSNVISTTTTSQCIFVDVNCSDINISNNICNLAGEIGIYVGSSNTSITNNTVMNSQLEGIKLFQANKCIISGNNVYDNDQAGTTNAGIELSDCDYCSVTGNLCTNVGGSTQDYGISLIGGSTLNNITGNTCQNTGEGFHVDACNRNNFSSNTSTGNSYGYREINASDYNLITSNILYNNSSSNLTQTGLNDVIDNNIMV